MASPVFWNERHRYAIPVEESTKPFLQINESMALVTRTTFFCDTQLAKSFHGIPSRIISENAIVQKSCFVYFCGFLRTFAGFLRTFAHVKKSCFIQKIPQRYLYNRNHGIARLKFIGAKGRHCLIQSLAAP